MILFRATGFFLVVVAFYSFGTVAGNRSMPMTSERISSPSFLDLAMIILFWLTTFVLYRAGYRAILATAAGGGIGLFAAFILHRWRSQNQGMPSSIPTTLRLDDGFRPNWRLFFRKVGRFQSGLLLSAFYFIAIMPFGIVAGNFGDPLGLKAPPGDSFWKQRGNASASLEEARRQS
jgi:hypothetical protein